MNKKQKNQTRDLPLSIQLILKGASNQAASPQGDSQKAFSGKIKMPLPWLARLNGLHGANPPAPPDRSADGTQAEGMSPQHSQHGPDFLKIGLGIAAALLAIGATYVISQKSDELTSLNMNIAGDLISVQAEFS